MFLIQILQIMKVIFTYLKLWVAVARHNFKWVKIHHQNLQLVVDEDDLKWVEMEKIWVLLLKKFRENVRSKTHRCSKLSQSLEMQNDASWEFKGLITEDQA